MTSRRRPLTIAISGAHGVGKTTLSNQLRKRLVASAVPTHHAYLYGCFVCRHAPSALADWTLRTAVASAQPARPLGLGGLIHRLHALVDASELAVRLAWAQRAAAHVPGGVLVLDRAPLDGLAKHDPPPGSLASWIYRRAARRVDRTFWLDAGAAQLADRLANAKRQRLSGVSRTISNADGTQRNANGQLGALELVRERYRRVSATLAGVEAIETTGAPVEAVADDLRQRIEALRG